MRPLIDALLTKVRTKSRALLRLRHVYTLDTLISQFKTHMWCHLEFSSGAIILATATERQRIDAMQRGFLREIGLSDSEAFVKYNFPPPSLRRAVAILGFVHKRVLGICHPALRQAFPFSPYPNARYHDKQLQTNIEKMIAHRPLYMRSVWHYILIYNRLPQGIIDSKTVSTFQGKLTQIAKFRCQCDEPTWRDAYQSTQDVFKHLHNAG